MENNFHVTTMLWRSRAAVVINNAEQRVSMALPRALRECQWHHCFVIIASSQADITRLALPLVLKICAATSEPRNLHVCYNCLFLPYLQGCIHMICSRYMEVVLMVLESQRGE